MLTVDTHVHVISKDTKKYPRAKDSSSEWVATSAVDVEGLLQSLDSAGVQKATIVQPKSAYAFDNSYAADSAERFSGRITAIGTIDHEVDDAPTTLGYWVRARNIRGLRLVSLAGSSNFSLASVPDSIWQTADELNICVIFPLSLKDAPDLHRLAKRFPKVTIILDHRSLIQIDGQAPFSKPQTLIDLARHSNIYAKFSTHLIDACRKADVDFADYFGALVQAFGAGRLMWGSDFPASHDRSYNEMVDDARLSVASFSEDEQELLMGGTALNFWPELSEPVAAAV